jgi:hypothetical protein
MTRTARLVCFAVFGTAVVGCGSGGGLSVDAAAGKTGSAGTASGGSGGLAGTGASSGGGGAGGTTGTTGAGPCPAQSPHAGDACALTTSVGYFYCEYGDDPDPSCRTHALCLGGTWQSNGVAPDCPSKLATSCPATMKAAVGSSCSEMGAWCSWGFGSGCQCTNCRPGPIQPYCSGSPTWDCPQAYTDCPTSMPRAGSPCSTKAAGGYCQYGCEFGARRCVDGYWNEEAGNCPMSTRAVKEDIRYLSPAEIDRVASETTAMRLANYRYSSPAFGAPGKHLGFIIEDSPGVPAVSPSHRTVDLYGFASMLLATSQAQQRRIEALEREVARLRSAEAQRKGSTKSRSNTATTSPE